MCDDATPPAMAAALLHDFEPAVEITLEPVDSVTVTVLIDNVTDMFMPDQGPAHRAGAGNIPARRSAVMATGEVPGALIAEHGFSVPRSRSRPSCAATGTSITPPGSRA